MNIVLNNLFSTMKRTLLEIKHIACIPWYTVHNYWNHVLFLIVKDIGGTITEPLKCKFDRLDLLKTAREIDNVY